MKLLDMFSIGNESISFQNGSFGKELENVFSAISETSSVKEEELLSNFKIIEAIVLKYTGLNTVFQHNDSIVGHVRLVHININNILIEKELKESFQKDIDTNEHALEMLKIAKNNKHSVNLKTSKVTGIFSQALSSVLININFFKSYKITPAQMTAVVLHEIGHLFTFYEYISRQVTTNQVLSAVCKTVINKNSLNKKEFIFKEASEILDINKDDIKNLSNQEDLKIISAVFIKASNDKLQSELGISNYDATSSEILADQFVSRHGYGREFIEVNDIFGKLSKDYAKNNSLRHFVNFSQAFRIVLTVTASGAFITLGVPLLSFIGLLGLGTLLGITSGEINKERKYDDLKVRFLRIREDTVNYLKNKDLEPEYIKKAIANLEIMDKIIKDTQEVRFLFDVIVDFINPKSKKIRNSIELQRNLEALAMNDFFVKSATLSTI